MAKKGVWSRMRRSVFCVLMAVFPMLLSSCEIAEAILSAFFNESGTSVSYSNRLRNTTWQSEDFTGGIGGFLGVYMSQRVDFGDTSFKITSQIISNGIDFGSGSKTGTYNVSGDTVTLTASDGTQWTGSLIGNSLTLDDIEYTRIQ